MNELERRTLLSAAGIGALAALAKGGGAGPLDPPAGPVAPTGRTLDEVYNKIPTPPAPGSPGSSGVLPDGRILVAGGNQPISITQSSRNYVLTSNVTVSSANLAAIYFFGGGSTLDLNGFTVSNQTGVGMTVGAGSLIRNGRVSGASGIYLSQADDAIIENVIFRFCARYALEGTARRLSVRRCHFLHTVGLGWPFGLGGDGESGATAIEIGGDMNSVHDCTVQGISPTLDPQGLATYGIRLQGNGSSIAGNRVCTLPGVTGTGIRMDGSGSYRDNTVQGFSVAYGIFGGTNGGGNVTA